MEQNTLGAITRGPDHDDFTACTQACHGEAVDSDFFKR